MMPLSSPHVHTQFCDGQSTAAEMVQAALQAGFVSLGFSSHAKQDFELAYALDEAREQAYIAEVNRLKRLYADQLVIRLGMERDYYATADRSLFEYTIAAVHYIRQGEGYVSVDGDAQALARDIRTHYQGSGLAFVQAYYALLGRYVRTYKPDIIAHFDLVEKNNRRLKFIDSGSAEYLKAAKEAMEEAFEGCRLLEVNTGAMARSGAETPYPTPELLRFWRQLGGQVILSSDCHLAKDIAFGYEEGLSCIRKAGFDRVQYLGTSGNLFETAAI